MRAGFHSVLVQKIPVPWDVTFLARWGVFVGKFGARYDANQTVVAVKLTGFNSATPELFLPYSENQPINVSGHKCSSYNDVANWQAAGYTRTLAESAWNTIAADFAAAFPNTPFEAMMLPGSFHPIDQNGEILPKARRRSGGNRGLSRGRLHNTATSLFWRMTA